MPLDGVLCPSNFRCVKQSGCLEDLGVTYMLSNTCSDSEVWSLDTPNIPQRSILFNLEPLGLGTANVESLTSYIMRLSNEHCLYPSDLMFRMALLHD